MLCDTAGVGGEGVLHLSTGSPFGHHPRLSMGCPRRGQWMSAQEDIPLTSTRANRIWSCRYSHSLHRLPPSPHTVYGLEDTLTHCIAYHRHHVSHVVLKTLSLTASPTTVSAYRIWSCRYSHSLHHLPPSPHTVYGLTDTLTPLHSHSPTSALASTQSRLRRRRTMRNRG